MRSESAPPSAGPVPKQLQWPRLGHPEAIQGSLMHASSSAFSGALTGDKTENEVPRTNVGAHMGF